MMLLQFFFSFISRIIWLQCKRFYISYNVLIQVLVINNNQKSKVKKMFIRTKNKTF